MRGRLNPDSSRVNGQTRQKVVIPSFRPAREASMCGQVPANQVASAAMPMRRCSIREAFAGSPRPVAGLSG